MHWLLGESTDWRACDDMAFAHSRDAWRSLPCSIACLPARQMVPEEGYIAGYYGTLDGPCLPCKMGNAAESTGFSIQCSCFAPRLTDAYAVVAWTMTRAVSP